MRHFFPFYTFAWAQTLTGWGLIAIKQSYHVRQLDKHILVAQKHSNDNKFMYAAQTDFYFVFANDMQGLNVPILGVK